MSKRLYTHSRVRYWYVYDVEDVCALFADFGLHPQTVRAWVKEGLKIIDSGKPALIYGQHLIDFLKSRNAKNKCATDFDQLFCMACKDARHVFQNKIHITQKTQVLLVQGRCKTCKGMMFQNYALKAIPKLRKRFILVDVSELNDCAGSTDKTHIEAPSDSSTSESAQGSLF